MITHGESNTKLFNVWQSMLQRCNNPKDKGYKNYGGRGVTVCDAWTNDYSLFAEWARANGYREGLSIDKDELSKELNIQPPIYSPETCRWATRAEQYTHQKKRPSSDLSKYAKMGWEKTQYRHLDVDGISEAVEFYFLNKISIRKLEKLSGFSRQTLSKYIKEAS